MKKSIKDRVYYDVVDRKPKLSKLHSPYYYGPSAFAHGSLYQFTHAIEAQVNADMVQMLISSVACSMGSVGAR